IAHVTIKECGLESTSSQCFNNAQNQKGFVLMSILLSQQAAYAARTAPLQTGHLRSAMTNNQTDIYVLDAREMTELWQADQREQGKNARDIATEFKALTGVEILLETVANYGSAGMDTKVLVALTADMYKSGK